MWEWLTQNPLVAGLTGAGIATMLMNRAVALPSHLWRAFRERFTLTLTVYSEQEAFEDFNQWIARNPGSQKFRSFAITSQWIEGEQRKVHSLSVGPGLHVLKHKRRWLLINRSEDKDEHGGGGERRQTITVSVLGRGRKFMDNLLAEIGEGTLDETKTAVWLMGGREFHLVEKKPNRNMDTVYVAPSVKDSLIADYKAFVARREWYQARGIPWRRGYMLEGPPGTGKSTLIFALAGIARKAVYVINVAAVPNDAALTAAINEARDGFVVIEDVDGSAAVHAREETLEAERKASKKDVGVTLSGLLNAIDGISARDGRVLFITSNRPHILDAALLRPGRIDMRVELARADMDQALAMFRSLTDGADEDAFRAWLRPHLPMAHADLQGVLLSGSWKLAALPAVEAAE